MALSKRWLNYYFGFATHAAEHSHATRDKVGAVAIKKQRIIASGYNGTCPGHDNACEDEDMETYPEVAHAEINLIGQLAQSTETTDGVAVFVTRQPCMHCAVALLAAGIREIHCLDKGSGRGMEHLKKHALVALYDQYSLEQYVKPKSILTEVLK